MLCGRLLAGLFSAIFFSLVFTLPAHAVPTAEELFKDARIALEERAYVCIIRISRHKDARGKHEIFQRHYHAPGGLHRIDPLMRTAEGELVGVGIFFVKNQNGRHLVDKDAKVVVSNPSSWGGITDIMNRPGMKSLLSRPGSTVMPSSFGKWEAWLITNEGRLSHKTWIGTENNFPLKIEVMLGKTTVFIYEIAELEFIPLAGVEYALFEVPEDFTRQAVVEAFPMVEGVRDLPWVPMVPELEKTPEGFKFEKLVPLHLKHELVFQAVFVSEPPSKVISVFQTRKRNLARLLSKRTASEGLNFAFKEREGVLFLAVGDIDPALLELFIALFQVDEERAKDMVDFEMGRQNLQGKDSYPDTE